MEVRLQKKVLISMALSVPLCVIRNVRPCPMPCAVSV